MWHNSSVKSHTVQQWVFSLGTKELYTFKACGRCVGDSVLCFSSAQKCCFIGSSLQCFSKILFSLHNSAVYPDVSIHSVFAFLKCVSKHLTASIFGGQIITCLIKISHWSWVGLISVWLYDVCSLYTAMQHGCKSIQYWKKIMLRYLSASIFYPLQ